MYVFSCEHDWESMLTCIYVASASKKGQKNIRLAFEPIKQPNLFDEYIHVEPDFEKASKVMDLINYKISAYVYHRFAYCAMAYEEDVLDVIYRVLLLCNSLGPQAIHMVQYEEVMRLQSIYTRLGKEVCRFQEFARFSEINHNVYVSHIEPKSHLVMALGPIFADRMPSEHFVIIDDVHKEAVIHPKDESFYLQKLTDEELERLKETESQTDGYTDLWKIFFETIAIKERNNERCQKNLAPLWTRKHMTEFQKEVRA